MASRKTHRGRRNRGRFGFLYVVLSFILILAALVVGSVVFFRAKTITVEGNARYTDEEIIQAAQVQIDDNLFSVNRPLTSQRILDALPYIRDVNIRRAFPDELVITVTETKAVAFLSCTEGHFLLDARGKLVEQTASPSASLPEIKGLIPTAPTVGARLEVDKVYQPRLDGLTGLLTVLEERALLDKLLYVDLSSASDLMFGYTNRFTAQIPITCDYDYKVRALEYVIAQLEANETGLIDLTRSDEVHVIPQ